MKENVSSFSTREKIMNGRKGTLLGLFILGKESSSGISERLYRIRTKRLSCIAVAASGRRLRQKIFRRWGTRTWSPWMAVGGSGKNSDTRLNNGSCSLGDYESEAAIHP